MRILNYGRIATVLLLAAVMGACSRGEKSKEIAALDTAYQAGVITKDEYEAKKVALTTLAAPLAALQKARDAGVLSQDEYEARKQRLTANAGTLAAVEKAYSAGVLSKDEYLAKKAALLAPESAGLAPRPAPASGAAPQFAPAPAVEPQPAVLPQPSAPEAPRELLNPPSPASQPAGTLPAQSAAAAPAPASNPDAAQGHVLRMKMIRAMDEHGFERPLVSASMLVPTDWQPQGGTTWNAKDQCNTTQTTLRASGPDGRAIEVFPAYNWVWADDPGPMRVNVTQKAQYGIHACDVQPPMAAADYLRRSLSRVRPNAQLVGIEPAPKIMEILQRRARETERSAMQYRLQQRVRPDAVRGRVKYSLNGQPVEEWVYVSTIVTGTLGPSMNLRTMQQTQAYTYNCVAYMTAERAPQGQLDANEKFFELLVSTYRVNPEWQARITKNALGIQQTELAEIRKRSDIVAKNADEIGNIRRQGFENQQRGQDRAAEQYSQNTRGVETYRNPATGETVDLSNLYGHAWVNNRGEYLLSDQASFDPSVAFKEEWKPLEHVRK